MKKFFRKSVVLFIMLAVIAPAFAKRWRVNRDGTVDIELWYAPAVTEAAAPPADWAAYRIIRQKLGINLVLTPLPASGIEQDRKISSAVSSDSLPDLLMITLDNFRLLQSQNLLASVDDMFAMMPNRTSKLYDQEARTYASIDGVCYALAQPGTIVRNEGLVIRKDWLDNLGLSVPKTTDELFEVMKAFTFSDPDGNRKNDTFGFGACIENKAISQGLGFRFDPIFGAFGVEGTWNLTKENAGLNINKPEFYDALVFIKKLVDAKVIDPNWVAYQKDDFRDAWKKGRFGIFREQNAALASEANYAPFDKRFPDGEFIVIDPPVGPDGKSSVGVYEQAYRMYALPASSAYDTVEINGRTVEKKRKIAELLEWMSSDEGYYLLGWGVEGVNWVKDPVTGAPTADGIPDPNFAYSKSEMQPLTQLRNLVYYNSDMELAARYPVYVTATSHKEMSALTVLRAMQSKKWTPVTGASLLPLPTAAQERALNRGIIDFVTGRRNLTKENWNMWLAEFNNKMGGKNWESEGIAKAEELGILY